METLLVIDDSAVDRRLAGGLLDRLPEVRVEFALSGDDALARMAELQPSLVVTDLVMPGCTGLELVERMAQEYPHIPVILMTNKGSEDIAVQALRAGAASYVPKSSLAQRLADTVLNVLGLAHQRRSMARVMACLVQSEYHFEIGAQESLIAPLIAHFQSHICAAGVCDEAQVIRVCIAIEEALRNALFHGNLEITSQQRDGDPAEYERVLQHRLSHAPWKDRRLHIHFRLSPREAEVTLRDEGPGFDPHKVSDPTDPENLERVSGRGLLLMRTFMDEVTFNARGNEVTMVKRAPQTVAAAAE
jgi:CheY-like chemotaxis protein